MPGFILSARAEWDGKMVAVDCRCETGRVLVGEVVSDGNPVPITDWTTDSDGCLRSARVPWEESERQPLFVELTCEQGEPFGVAIFDARSWPERRDDPPPGMDKKEFLSLRDQLLFERYGGQVADDLGSEAQGRLARRGGGRREKDSYSVEALERARAHFAVVDCWAGQMKDALDEARGPFERDALVRDGRLLVDAFRRQESTTRKVGRSGRLGPGSPPRSWAFL